MSVGIGIRLKKNKKRVGEYLTKVRKESGLTQRNVAQNFGWTSPQFVSNWERGEACPSMDTIIELKSLLKVSARDYEKQILEILIEDFTATLRGQSD